MDSRCPRCNKVVVVGGGSFQGKSLLALHIAHAFSIPKLLSTDCIRNTLKVLNPDDPRYSTSTYLMPPRMLASQFVEVSRVLMGLLRICEERGEDVLVEGIHFSPGFLTTVRRWDNVFALCLDNRADFRQRVVYKGLTRRRFAILDGSSSVHHETVTTANVARSRYVLHQSRMVKIHRGIISSFRTRGFRVLRFHTIHEAYGKARRALRDLGLRTCCNR